LLFEEGRASPYQILPVVKMDKQEDVAIIIELFRMQYERLKPDDKQNYI
jgi:hypothetical protein